MKNKKLEFFCQTKGFASKDLEENVKANVNYCIKQAELTQSPVRLYLGSFETYVDINPGDSLFTVNQHMPNGYSCA